MPTEFSTQDKAYLLKLAREAITSAVNGTPLSKITLEELPVELSVPGASFVTLTIDGQLRGCIGTLEAYQPLALDVQTRAVQAALEDYRFHPVTKNELPLINIEISRLTPAIPLNYSDPSELPGLLRPGIDGVVLGDGHRRATYLPQVWEQLPNPEEFLSSLCAKMGASRNLWRQKVLLVERYQVEEFREP
ncbi:MAG: AmmeMemoRadiSam system protein A [Anaerolineaceae bacterium]